MRVRICFQRLAAWGSRRRWAWCHLNCTWYSIIIGGNASAWATAKPSIVKWSSAAWVLFDSDGNGKFGLLNYVFRYFDDNHYTIHTHDAWPSQMHSNMLISGGVKYSQSLVFDSANQHIFVYLWGPIVMGPHNDKPVAQCPSRRVLINMYCFEYFFSLRLDTMEIWLTHSVGKIECKHFLLCIYSENATAAVVFIINETLRTLVS